MRVGLVSSAVHTCPNKGYGSEVTTWLLAKELSIRGHEVILFAPDGSLTPPNGKLVKIAMAPPGDAAAILASEGSPLTKFARELRSCDIVHDCSLSAHTAELVHAAFLDKIPHVATLNGIFFARPAPPANHNVVVVSQAAKYHAENRIGAFENTPFRAQFHCDPGTLSDPFVVRYGTDVEFYAPAENVRDYLLYVGRPHPSKGFDIILGLAERMPEKLFVLAWRAWLPDHVHYDKMYRAEVEQRGLKNIQFVELPDGPEHHIAKRDLQASASVALHPATYVDACPSTLMEALACGTPVVTTKHGGNPEIVIDGEDGVCLPIPQRYWEDPQWTRWLDDWAAAIHRSYTLSRHAIRQRAVVRHSAGRAAEDYLNVYESVMNGVH